MFVELVIFLQDPPNAALTDDAVRRYAGHRVEPTVDGVAVLAEADGQRRTEFSFGTTSVYDDPEWGAAVAAADPEGWQRVQPVVHQVDVNGRSLVREDLEPAYAVAIELAAACSGLVWDAVTDQPVGDDPRAAAEQCARALECAEAEFVTSQSRRGLLSRLFGR